MTNAAGLNNGSSVRYYVATGLAFGIKAISGNIYNPTGTNLYVDVPRPDGETPSEPFGGTTKKWKFCEIGTTAQRPTPSAAVNGNLVPGYMYYDTTLSAPVWYTGSGWVNISGVSV
jgi:hypothetical protein